MRRSGVDLEKAYIAEFYDYTPPFRNRQDIEFFVQMAQEANGPVLELGCGTGRVLIPTARAGVEIVGLDASTEMLSLCKRKLRKESADVQARVSDLVEGDMRSFDLARRFALVTIPFHPFTHMLTVEDQLSCLETIRDHLTQGGRVVFDTLTPALKHLIDERYLNEFGQEPEFTVPDGRRVVRRSRFLSRDLANQVIEIEIILYITGHDGQTEQFKHYYCFRYMWKFEAEHLLARCGFKVEQVYADYDRSPYGSKYPGELIMVAQKR